MLLQYLPEFIIYGSYKSLYKRAMFLFLLSNLQDNKSLCSWISASPAYVHLFIREQYIYHLTNYNVNLPKLSAESNAMSLMLTSEFIKELFSMM